MSLALHSIKSQFPIFTHRPELVYLDNAATSQKPFTVIKAMGDFYEKENASVHRGLYDLSVAATKQYEGVRKKVANVIGASANSIAFTKGTTESINQVAQGFVRARLKEGDNVVISAMEHHANFIPWQQLCFEAKAFLKVIPVNSAGELELSQLEKLLDGRTRFLSVAHMSNVLGTINPIAEIIDAGHKKNIPVMVDAAQSVGHIPIDVKNLKVDFLAFSAHKMFGPFGTGVLYSREEFANQLTPLTYGGGSIRNVTIDNTEFLDYPANLEAGTANVAGVLGLGAAIDFVQELSLNEISIYTQGLADYFKERASSVDGIKVVGNPKHYGSIVSFQVDKIHPHDVASFLSNSNIAVRAGHHCAQPLLDSLGILATVRVSFAIYNTKEDVDKTIEALIALKKFWS